MKNQLILLFSILLVSCVDPENLDFSSGIFCEVSPEVELKNGLFFLPNAQQPYSGDNICIYKGNNQYATQGLIKKGLRDGKQTWWYESGQTWVILHYKDGKENGMATAWHENGQKMSEINYINGNEDGKGVEWNKDGTIVSEAIYKDGECISGDCPE
jgi:antitoxin component YwqK of YwqJK toxin-antitoxin module